MQSWRLCYDASHCMLKVHSKEVLIWSNKSNELHRQSITQQYVFIAIIPTIIESFSKVLTDWLLLSFCRDSATHHYFHLPNYALENNGTRDVFCLPLLSIIMKILTTNLPTKYTGKFTTLYQCLVFTFSGTIKPIFKRNLNFEYKPCVSLHNQWHITELRKHFAHSWITTSGPGNIYQPPKTKLK